MKDCIVCGNILYVESLCFLGGDRVYKKLVNTLYILNILSQALITLAFPIGLGFGLSWLLVTKLSAPGWLYAVFITLGALSGFYSMIKFVLSAMASYDRLEKERNSSKKINKMGNNND